MQEGLLKGLSVGTSDASDGVLTDAADRLREVDLSPPYFVLGLGVAVALRASLDRIGVASSFLSIRFLSVCAWNLRAGAVGQRDRLAVGAKEALVPVTGPTSC